MIAPQGGEYYLFSNLIIDKSDLGEFDYDYLMTSFKTHKYEPDEKLSELYSKFRKFVLDNPDKFNKFYYNMIEEMPFYLNDTNNIIKVSNVIEILKLYDLPLDLKDKIDVNIDVPDWESCHLLNL